jgi:DDE_Tnp_1-associated
MDEFAAVSAALDDPRTGNAKRHLLLAILLIALCTLLSGGASCADMARPVRSCQAGVPGRVPDPAARRS